MLRKNKDLRFSIQNIDQTEKVPKKTKILDFPQLKKAPKK